eukprot:2460155-Pleurochrysis_carterae.AAC.4
MQIYDCTVTTLGSCDTVTTAGVCVSGYAIEHSRRCSPTSFRMLRSGGSFSPGARVSAPLLGLTFQYGSMQESY